MVHAHCVCKLSCCFCMYSIHVTSHTTLNSKVVLDKYHACMGNYLQTKTSIAGLDSDVHHMQHGGTFCLYLTTNACIVYSAV